MEELNNWPVGLTPSELLLAFGDDWNAMERYGLDEIGGFTTGYRIGHQLGRDSCRYSAELLSLAGPELSRRFACRENLAAGGVLGVAVPLEPASGKPRRLPARVPVRYALRWKGMKMDPLAVVS